MVGPVGSKVGADGIYVGELERRTIAVVAGNAVGSK